MTLSIRRPLAVGALLFSMQGERPDGSVREYRRARSARGRGPGHRHRYARWAERTDRPADETGPLPDSRHDPSTCARRPGGSLRPDRLAYPRTVDARRHHADGCKGQPVVRRGDPVELFVETGSFSVSTEAIAQKTVRWGIG